MDKKYIVWGAGGALVLVAGFLYYRSKRAEAAAVASESQAATYYQSAALPSSYSGGTVSSDGTTVSGSTTDYSGLLASLVSQNATAAQTAASQTNSALQASTLQQFIAQIAQPGATGISANLTLNDSGVATGYNVNVNNPAPTAPAAQAMYVLTPDIAVTKGGGQITGYTPKLVGYKAPVYNATTRTWSFDNTAKTVKVGNTTYTTY